MQAHYEIIQQEERKAADIVECGWIEMDSMNNLQLVRYLCMVISYFFLYANSDWIQLGYFSVFGQCLAHSLGLKFITLEKLYNKYFLFHCFLNDPPPWSTAILTSTVAPIKNTAATLVYYAHKSVFPDASIMFSPVHNTRFDRSRSMMH